MLSQGYFQSKKKHQTCMYFHPLAYIRLLNSAKDKAGKQVIQAE
jgi:hypothetical protein